MACKLPYNYVSVGGREVLPANFVSGTGTITSTPTDIRTTLADGTMPSDRQSMSHSATNQARGDRSDMNTPAPSCSEVCIFKEGGTAGTIVEQFDGVCTTSFDSSTNTTTMDIQSDGGQV